MVIDRSIPPPIRDFSNIRLSVPDPIILSNGMKLWIAGNGEDEISKLSIYLTGGTFQETLPMQATTCSMAVFNGNKNMSYAQIAEAIDYFGAWRASQVYDNCTEFAISSLNDNFSQTLPIFIDSLMFPTFPDNEFELNKRQLAVNIATAREKVKYIANKEMMRQYFGYKHPLASDPTPEGINSLTQEQIQNFYFKYYKAQNCNLVIAGHITDKEIATIEDILSKWKPNGAPSPQVEPQVTPSSEMLKVVHKEGAVQAAIAMALKTVPRRHPDYFKIRILTTVLGGYFGSRLMSNIREDKGYTYGIGASLSGRSFDGHISISTECDTQYCWDVINETKKEMKRLCTEPIPKEELDTVKRHMLSDLVKTLDTPFNIAGYIGNIFLYGTYPSYFNEHIQAILDATSIDLIETAQRYLDSSLMHIVIACDENKMPEKEFS